MRDAPPKPPPAELEAESQVDEFADEEVTVQRDLPRPPVHHSAARERDKDEEVTDRSRRPAAETDHDPSDEHPHRRREEDEEVPHRSRRQRRYCRIE